jgi:predicted esterase
MRTSALHETLRRASRVQSLGAGLGLSLFACGGGQPAGASTQPSLAADGGVHAASAAGSSGAHALPATATAGVPASAAQPAGANALQAGHAGSAADSGDMADAGPGLPTNASPDASLNQADAGTRRTTPDPKFLVPATGPCPEFANGYATFNPDGESRQVLLYISDAAKTLDGPLVFSWHSTIPSPEQASVWIGDDVITKIEALGGIVAAPSTGTPSTTRPWDNTPGGAQNTDNDQRLMDEVLACAITKVGVDLRHIHAIGMSAGGLKTAQVSLRRSGYLASVVVYSGGLTDGDNPPDQDPDNLFAAMIFYGGPTDISPVDGIPYTDASNNYLKLLRSKGRFAFLCNHGMGHNVPQDSQSSAWQFMQDHAFGTYPSPYAKQLPSGFPSYCSLQ